MIGSGAYGFDHVNVASQRHDRGSLLNWMESVIRTRKEVPEIGWGDFAVIETASPAILAIRYDWEGNSVLCVHNLSGTPMEISLSPEVEGPEGRVLVDLLTGRRSEAGDDGRHCLMMERYGYHWFRLGGLDAPLKRRVG